MDVRPGYKLTEVGIIPSNWEVRHLAQVSRKITDGDHLTPKRASDGYFLLSARNVLNGRIDVSDVDYVGAAEYQRMKQRCNPEAGDILISCSGTIGRVAVVPPGLDCVLVRSAALVKINSQLADGVFLQFWLQACQAQAQIASSVNQGAQPNLFLNHIERLACPNPPLPEQHAIATALSDVDALLGALDRLIAKKRDLKRAAMHQLLSGQIRLPGFHGEWKMKRLEEIAKLNRLNVMPSLQPNKLFMHFSLPGFDAGRNAQIEPGSSIGSNKFGVPAAAVLVSKLNPRIPRIWAPTSVPENAVASTEWLVLTPRDGIDRQYLLTLCSSPAFCAQMELAATGTTGSHQRISPITALDIRIDVTMDPFEQSAIASVLSDMDAELSALEARCDKTRALKQGMMQELLSGRTRLVPTGVTDA